MVNRREKENRKWLMIFCIVSLFLAGCLLMIKMRPWSNAVGYGSSITENANNNMPEEETLKHQQQLLQEQYGPLYDIRIRLQFGKIAENLTFNTIADWVTAQKDGDAYSYTVNDEAVSLYTKTLADKYSNFESHIKFIAADGKERTLPNMSTGWIFDDAYAAEQIKKFITEGQSVNLVLTDGSTESNNWWLRVAADYETPQKRGDCYAEVSISQQCMWLHKKGKIILTSPVVTGNPNLGCDTPIGAFVVQNKEQDAVLYGADYMTTVKYWIGFTYAIGFHDADWQDGFGGNFYLENGSHGCVNMPDDAVEKLYQLAYVNMPVYVYY